MNRRIHPLSFFLFISDMFLVALGLFAASRLRLIIPLGKEISPELVRVPPAVYLIALVCWGVSLVANQVYDPERVLRWYNEATRVVWASALATIIFAGALYMSFRQLSRLQFVYFMLVITFLLLASRATLRVYYRALGRTRPGGRSKVLIVGAGDLGVKVAHVLLDHSRWGFDIIGFLDDDPAKRGKRFEGFPVLGALEELRQVVDERRIEEVWIALPVWAYDRLNQVVAALERLPVRIKVVPDYFSLALVQARAEVLGGIPVIGLREPVIEGWPRLVKRLFDLAVSAALLVLLAPAMLLLALLIRLDSPGPVIFRQKRVGENGRIFDMLKFRTMVPEAEKLQAEVLVRTEDGEIIHKCKDDPRVTRVGRFLRRYSLDELPQLFNVLIGDMSMVGPRPELPWLVERYKPWQRKRFAVPQGITGWWQINGRSDKPMHLNTQDDLYYVYNYSLWLDIQILLRTPLAVIRGKGAF